MNNIFFILIIIAFFLDYSFLPMLGIDSTFGANFTLLILVVIFLKKPFKESFWWAILGGLLFDYVSSAPLGTFVFTFLSLGFLLELFRQKFQTKAPNALSLLFVFLSSFVFVSVVYLAVWQLANFLGIWLNQMELQIENAKTLFFLKVALSFFGMALFWMIEKLEWLGGEQAVKLEVE